MSEKGRLMAVIIGGFVLLGGGIVTRLFKISISGSECLFALSGMFLLAAASVLFSKRRRSVPSRQ